MARQNNAEYWARRFKNMEDALQDQSFAYVQNLEAQFAAAQAEIERQMAAWYQRFAVNNEITYADAKRLLTTGELAEFHWTVGEYIAYGQQNALDGRWMKQLENASAKVHISRLEALKLQIQQQAEVLYSNQLDAVDMAARRMYEGSYYHTAFEVQRGLGVGWTMHAINETTITKVLSRPWTTDNQTFRDRCWTNKQSLVNAVNTQLTQMIIRGEAPDRAISAISKQFGVARNKAGRLVMTESAYFSSAAQKDCFNALDVERYQIVASFDHETCTLCADMDGRVLKMSEYQVGLTAPPFHPWCRCCTCPYFEDMAGLGERWTRNEDGTTKKVPRDMTFEDWKKGFVEPAPLSSDGAGATMQAKAIRDFQTAKAALEQRGVHFDDSLQKLDERLLVANAEKLDELLGRYPRAQAYAQNRSFTLDGKPAGKSNYIGQCSYKFDGSSQTITLNPKYFNDFDGYVQSQLSMSASGFKMPVLDERACTYTLTHEFGHYVENILIDGIKAANPDDWSAMWARAMRQPTMQKTRKVIVNWYAEQARAIRKEIVSIAHELDASVNQKNYAAHISEYGRSSPQEFFAECFANMEGGKPNVLGEAMRLYLERRFS